MADAKAIRSERLAAARRVGRMMSEPEFRDGLASEGNSEIRVVASALEESLGDVFDRIERVGVPATICVPLGSSGIASLKLTPADDSDSDADCQECGPEATIGMLLSVLVQHGKPMRISVREPVTPGDKASQLRLAFA